MTKPCLPYTGQFKTNIERCAELYPPDRPRYTMAANGNEVRFTPMKHRFDLEQK